MILCSCLTFLPVGRRHLTGLGLTDGPAGEGLVLVAHQGPPEEGPAGEAGDAAVVDVIRGLGFRRNRSSKWEN